MGRQRSSCRFAQGYADGPALGPEGQLYVGFYNPALVEPEAFPSEYVSELVAFNPDGSRAWSYELHGGLSSKILVTPDGMVYTTSRESGGSLYVFTSDGELVLEEMFGGWTSMELVSVAPDGRGAVYRAAGFEAEYQLPLAVDAIQGAVVTADVNVLFGIHHGRGAEFPVSFIFP